MFFFLTFFLVFCCSCWSTCSSFLLFSCVSGVPEYFFAAGRPAVLFSLLFPSVACFCLFFFYFCCDFFLFFCRRGGASVFFVGERLVGISFVFFSRFFFGWSVT